METFSETIERAGRQARDFVNAEIDKRLRDLKDGESLAVAVTYSDGSSPALTVTVRSVVVPRGSIFDARLYPPAEWSVYTNRPRLADLLVRCQTCGDVGCSLCL